VPDSKTAAVKPHASRTNQSSNILLYRGFYQMNRKVLYFHE